MQAAQPVHDALLHISFMLVSAFAGYKNTMTAYNVAVSEEYRFFSFGDSMMII